MKTYSEFGMVAIDLALSSRPHFAHSAEKVASLRDLGHVTQHAYDVLDVVVHQLEGAVYVGGGTTVGCRLSAAVTTWVLSQLQPATVFLIASNNRSL